MLVFGLPYPEVGGELFSNSWSSPADYTAVKLNAKALLAID